MFGQIKRGNVLKLISCVLLTTIPNTKFTIRSTANIVLLQLVICL